MGNNKLFPLAAALLLLGPSAAFAQRSAAFSTARPTTAARRSTVFSSPIRVRPRGSFGNTTLANNGFFNNGFFGNGLFTNAFGNVTFFSPNGLGINGINLITNQDIGIEAAIDPATQLRLATAARFARSFPGLFPAGAWLLDGGGGYILPPEPVENEQPAGQQQQPIIVMQQPAAQQAAPSGAEQPAPEPLPDVGQFTLVMRDGTQIEAVAFTHMKDRIVYITREGARRSVALSEVDVDATVRVNQERGTPLELPL